MRCVEPIGHGHVLDGLWRAARAGRLAHALLFVGPDGVGKFLAAERLAFGIFCARGPLSSVAPGAFVAAGTSASTDDAAADVPQGPCGTCGPCKRLKAGSHPDVFVVDPESEDEESIKLERITARDGGELPSIGEFLSLRPMEGGWRIVIVRAADRMTDEAQNALLKTLEEPGESTLLVLVTAHPDDLLPTVQSRCVRVAFDRLPLPDVERMLVDAGLEREEARGFARWSRGAPGLALSLRARGAGGMRELLVRVLSGEIDPLAAAHAAAELEGDFPGDKPLARARERARTFLDLTQAILRDALRARNGVDAAGLAHGDLALLAAGRSERALVSALECVFVARQDVDRNLAPDAVLERAWLVLGELAPTSSGGRRRLS